MKKSLMMMICLMIAVVIAGGIFLWSRGSSEGVLDGLDPDSFDAEVTCVALEDHTLVCNAGQDIYLYLDDVKVFLQTADTEIDENGDERIHVSYGKSSLEELEEKIAERGEISAAMWLTRAGKVKTVMILEESFVNNSASLVNLEGLDPGSYTAAGTALRLNRSSIRLAPVSYTVEEQDKFTEYIKDYPLSADVRFYHEIIRITEKETGEDRNIRYEKLDLRQARELLEEDGTAVFVWFGQQGEIVNVMLCSEEAGDA